MLLYMKYGYYINHKIMTFISSSVQRSRCHAYVKHELPEIASLSAVVMINFFVDVLTMTVEGHMNWRSRLLNACVVFSSVGSIRRKKWKSSSRVRRRRILSIQFSTWLLESRSSRMMNTSISRCALFH